ncbi:solute carrier family 23 protein, partial [Bacillus mycoides]|uniref:solute carrier family 23 protein n=1 Tax=Bacillus mycoides TaxID=1405 RepID=UPI00307CF2B0
DGKESFTQFSVALVRLAIRMSWWIFGRGFLSMIGVLVGMMGGYMLAYLEGVVDLKGVGMGKWFDVADLTIAFVRYRAEF